MFLKEPTQNLKNYVEKFQRHALERAGLPLDVGQAFWQQRKEAELALTQLAAAKPKPGTEAFEHFQYLQMLVSMPVPTGWVGQAPAHFSQYQRHDDFVMLYEFASELRADSGSRGRETLLQTSLKRIALCTTPLGRCNGFVYRDPSSDQYALVLDDQLASMLVHICSILAKLATRENGQVVWDTRHAERTIERDPRLTQHYQAMLIAMAQDGNCARILPPRLSDDEQDLVSSLSKLCLQWCLSHEIGHVLLGHLHSQNYAGMIEIEALDDLDPHLENELQADLFADELVKTTLSSTGQSDNLAGFCAVIVLGCYDSLYRLLAKNVGITSVTVVDTAVRFATRHPSPRERLVNIQSANQGKTNFCHFVFWCLNQFVEQHSSPIKNVHPGWRGLVEAMRAVKN